jgi:outer membrane protein TolC
MKKLICLIIFFACFFCRIALAEEISLTIDEAINMALRDNRDILLKAEDVNKSKAKIREARAALYPSLTLTSTWSRNNGYYSKDFSPFNYQVGAKQYLYKGGETVNTIKYNEHLLDANQAILDKTKLETILNVKKSFYTLLLSNQYAEVNKAILKNTKSHLEYLDARYKKGLASESEILQVKSSLESVKQAYENSLNQIESSQALLNNYLYLDNDVRVIPAGELSYTEEEIVFDQGLLYALGKRPEIKQYDSQIKASEKSVDIAKSDNRPSVYASWDYYARDHAALGTARNWGDNNIIGITFSWPIFDGWATKSKIEQAVVDLKEAQVLREKAASDIALDFKNAYIGLKNAIVKIDATESDLKMYNDDLKGAREKFKQGIVSSLDLNDAVLKQSISKFNRDSAVYDYIIAKSNLDKSMGGVQ